MSIRTVDLMQRNLQRRYARERRFRWYGRLSILLALVFLLLLFSDILGKGISAFRQTEILLSIELDGAAFSGFNNRTHTLADINYDAVVKQALYARFPEVSDRGQRRDLARLLSPGAGYILRDRVLDAPSLLGTTVQLWLPADDDVDMYVKQDAGGVSGKSGIRRLSDRQVQWIGDLRDSGQLQKHFNTFFFTASDSREPELSGIRGALAGSFLTLLVTLALSFPIGVGAAVYLEEFAPRKRWIDIIEVNVNNLAAVPSIIFGLLGLAVFINFFGVPRSAPLAGGLVLTLMTLPTIIISSRAAIRSVPPSVREAALGVGASHVQTVFSHVLPLALPGMLTGTIIGMAQALGETAPLLMIGMVAFVVDVPAGITDSATVLPVQIYLWADSAERAFEERTAAAIMVLLGFLIMMNAAAIYMRRRFENKW